MFAGPVGEHYRFDSRMMEEVREESIKEAYALFGLAYFHSECLHRELCHAYVLSILPLGTAMTRPRFEEALVRAYALTLGQVIAGLEDSFDRDLFDRLTDAVAKRNFLAHHFWFWRCHLMTSEAGLSEMQKELSELSSLFHNLDLEVTGKLSTLQCVWNFGRGIRSVSEEDNCGQSHGTTARAAPPEKTGTACAGMGCPNIEWFSARL